MMSMTPDGMWRWDDAAWVANAPLAQSSAEDAAASWKQTRAVVVSLLIVGSVLAVLMATIPSSTQAATPPAAPAPTSVIYYVSGTAGAADITYQTPSGISQQEGVDVPMVTKGTPGSGMTMHGFSRGDFVYIAAQRLDDVFGGPDVTCKIVVDGKVIAENTARGGYSIATCQGTVPR